MKFKNIITVSLCALVSCSAAFGLSACNNGKENSDSTSGSAFAAEVYDAYANGANGSGNTLNYDEWLASIKGEKGDRGERGLPGERGEKGDKGDKGDKGERGEQGSAGERGEKGEKGDKGARGEQGPTGERGEKGEKGDKGERGMHGKRGKTGFAVCNYNSLDAAVGIDDAYVVLCDDIVVTDDIKVTGKNVTLDLNGHKISNEQDIWDQDIYRWALITVSGSLKITGNGSLIAKDNDCFCVTVTDGGKCVIESGTFVGNIHAIYVYDGELKVNGGTYSVVQKYSAARPDDYVLNCYDQSYRDGKSEITVNGGTFYGFNPENCYAEGANTNFLADGLTTEKTTVEGKTVYTVVEKTVEEDNSTDTSANQSSN